MLGRVGAASRGINLQQAQALSQDEVTSHWSVVIDDDGHNSPYDTIFCLLRTPAMKVPVS